MSHDLKERRPGAMVAFIAGRQAARIIPVRDPNNAATMPVR
jgi:hypothetical protein